MKTAKPAPAIAQLLALLDEACNKRSWHGTNLRGSIRGLSAEQAGWRARPGGHNIAQIVLHAAYWKYCVRRRLRGEKRGSFPLKGSDWFELPEPLGADDWKGYVALLNDQHRQLRDTIAGLRPQQLDRTPPGSKIQTALLIRGVAMHDVYHAGQIQVIKGAHK